MNVIMNDSKVNANHSLLNSATQIFRNWDIWEILLLVLFIFGTIGNSLTIIVMRSKRMRKRNESLLISTISILDMSLLTIKLFVNLQKINKIPIYSFCVLIQFVLPQIVAWQVYWLIVVVTIERYIAVSKPFQVNLLMSKMRCKMIIVTLFIIFTILSSTQAACLKYNEKKPHYCIVKEVVIFENSSKKTDICMVYMKNVFPWIKSALMSWIPWVPALVFNILILISLNKSKKMREVITIMSNGKNRRHDFNSMSPMNSRVELCQNGDLKCLLHKKSNILSQLKGLKRELKEKQITITLCTISFTFILFTAPFTIFEVVRKISDDKSVTAFLNSRDMHRLGHFLLDCLHVTNFIFYCVFARGFRSELRKFFLNCNRRCIKNQEYKCGSNHTGKTFL